MSTWEIIRLLHLIAMAFFVGGQFVMAAAVVPATRSLEDKTTIRTIARHFGYGSLIAIIVLVITGSLMAEHYDKWNDQVFQIKMVALVVTGLLIGWHTRRPQLHALEGVVFVLSIAMVWMGVAIAHY